jgi:aminomethyltransferase
VEILPKDNLTLKKTPLYETHVELGGRMVEFSGWLMPVQYESIIKEHQIARSSASIFDISHMGEFILEGADVISFLQLLMVNDLRLLENSKGQYSCICYENGTVVDDLVYYQENPERFRMIVNASNIEKDYQWIQDHIGDYKVRVTNLSSDRCRLAFQGPKADEMLAPLVDTDLSKLNRFYFTFCNLDGVKIFLARTGYTGEKGFEISFDKNHVRTVWNALIKTGARPAGLGARDSLRLEACYSLYGHELTNSITPVEAGIGWVIKSKEGINYIGKEILLRQKSEGTSRILVGLNLLDRGIIREHCKLYKNGVEIGYVTSGGYSPTLKKTIGLALVKTAYSAIGTEFDIEIRKKILKAKVVSTPFYRNI